MRILYILTSLGVGGAERQTIELAERMSARGHEVRFLVLKDADQEWPVGLPVVRLQLRKEMVSVTRGVRAAFKFVEGFRPDLIHSHTYPANIFARVLRLGMCELSRPVLVNTIHNVFEGGWVRMLSYRLSSLLVDRVTAVSAAAAERYVGIGAVPARKMRVLTNGIDTAFFSPEPGCRWRMREQMGVGDDFVWLAVGRIAPAKDYPNLLRAFALIRPEQTGTILGPWLWIAGEGAAGALQVDHESGAEHRVKHLGLRRDVKELLDAADGFVLSSAWEGMPLVMGEAMAMGKPVVATAVGGVEELVGEAGVLVKAKDSVALAEAMRVVMGMTVLERKQMGQVARGRVEKLFSIDAKAEEWELLYRELAAGMRV